MYAASEKNWRASPMCDQFNRSPPEPLTTNSSQYEKNIMMTRRNTKEWSRERVATGPASFFNCAAPARNRSRWVREYLNTSWSRLQKKTQQQETKWDVNRDWTKSKVRAWFADSSCQSRRPCPWHDSFDIASGSSLWDLCPDRSASGLLGAPLGVDSEPYTRRPGVLSGRTSLPCRVCILLKDLSKLQSARRSTGSSVESLELFTRSPVTRSPRLVTGHGKMQAVAMQEHAAADPVANQKLPRTKKEVKRVRSQPWKMHTQWTPFSIKMSTCPPSIETIWTRRVSTSCEHVVWTRRGMIPTKPYGLLSSFRFRGGKYL